MQMPIAWEMKGSLFDETEYKEVNRAKDFFRYIKMIS